MEDGKKDDIKNNDSSTSLMIDDFEKIMHDEDLSHKNTSFSSKRNEEDKVDQKIGIIMDNIHTNKD